MKKNEKNPWLLGLLFALIFFGIMGIVGNLSEDPLTAGESFANWLLPLVLIVLGFYLGTKLKMKKG